MDSPSLPIEEIRGELLDALQAPSPRILLKAPTGSGKSTGVPPMMDDYQTLLALSPWLRRLL